MNWIFSKYNTLEDITSEITRFGEKKKSSRVSKLRERGPNIGHMGDKKKKGEEFWNTKHWSRDRGIRVKEEAMHKLIIFWFCAYGHMKNMV